MNELRRLAAGVLLPGFAGTRVPGWLAGLLEQGLAGVCLFGHNVQDDAQVRRLTAEVHGHDRHALVASDEEGVPSPVSTRPQARPGRGTAPWGPWTTRTRPGVDLALAPVLDVNTEADNPVIGVRSFGDSTDLVTRHGAAFVEGLHAGGVLACAKHFPGHGATRVDSHVALPVLEHSLEEIRARDLPPFRAAARAGVQCVMTAHVVVRAVDDRPGTTSPTVLRMLRDEVGFDGAVLSDALDMRAVARGDDRSVAVEALSAGVDLLCLGNPGYPEVYDDRARVEAVLDEIEAAVLDGRLPRERLTGAAGRVAARRAPAGAPTMEPATDDAGRGVAARALRVTGEVAVPGPAMVVTVRSDVALASGRRESGVASVLAERRPRWPCVEVDDPGEIRRVLDDTQEPYVVVVAEGRVDARAGSVVRAAVEIRPDAVVVHGGVAAVPDLSARQVRTFGGGRAVADAVADRLLAGG